MLLHIKNVQLFVWNLIKAITYFIDGITREAVYHGLPYPSYHEGKLPMHHWRVFNKNVRKVQWNLGYLISIRHISAFYNVPDFHDSMQGI